MYHIELRHFPHNFCRFNLTERELRETLLDAWVRGEWIEVGERKWNAHQAKLTVLEGPRLAVGEISMGRGWGNAKRRGQDVTERLLAAARPAPVASVDADAVTTAAATAVTAAAAAATTTTTAAAGAQSVEPAPSTTAAERKLAVESSLAATLLALLGEDSAPLMRAWQLALERHPERTPSECLALAEGLVRR